MASKDTQIQTVQTGHVGLNVSDLNRSKRRLQALNVHFHYEGVVRQADGLESVGLFFEGPDGTQLEIYSPTGAADHPVPVPDAPSCGFF